jgi:hypothetical protein
MLMREHEWLAGVIAQSKSNVLRPCVLSSPFSPWSRPDRAVRKHQFYDRNRPTQPDEEPPRNIWFTNAINSTVSEFYSAGAALNYRISGRRSEPAQLARH